MISTIFFLVLALIIGLIFSVKDEENVVDLADMLNSRLNADEFFHGLVEDTRSAEEKQKDFKHDEIAEAAPITWTHKSDYRSYELRNQNGSSSCVGQACAKALETLTGNVQSARPIYKNRNNAPEKGMWLQSAGTVLRSIGTTTEILEPSQKMTEEEMNREVFQPTPLKISSYVFVNPDIDSIASVIEKYKHCILTFKSTYEEWTTEPFLSPNSKVFFGHAVCAVDYALKNDKKVLVIEDSWGLLGTTSKGQRFISEEYIKERCTGAMYITLPTETKSPKPIGTFKNQLFWGLHSQDVVFLQDFLKWQGFLSPDIPSTGKFFNMTAHALQKWQVANGLMDFANVTDFTKVRFGFKSITKANEILNG